MMLRSLAALALVAFAPVVFADVKSDVLAAHEAMVKAGKFRTIGTTTSGKDSQEFWSEAEWPDRFHARNAGGEFIMLPGKTYMKQGGQWMVMPMDMSAMVKSFTPSAIREQFDNMRNAKDLGEMEINGRTLHGYEYDTSATIMGIKAESHVKLWIDPDSHLVIKQEADSSAMGQKSHTVQTYEYDDTISIKAPM
jgi:hypothetical protein